jgi:hypothetical protein
MLADHVEVLPLISQHHMAPRASIRTLAYVSQASLRRLSLDELGILMHVNCGIPALTRR